MWIVEVGEAIDSSQEKLEGSKNVNQSVPCHFYVHSTVWHTETSYQRQFYLNHTKGKKMFFLLKVGKFQVIFKGLFYGLVEYWLMHKKTNEHFQKNASCNPCSFKVTKYMGSLIYTILVSCKNWLYPNNLFFTFV